MRISKKQLRRIIKETLDTDATTQFNAAVSQLQAVLARHDLSSATVGTYDPMDQGDAGAAWADYDLIRGQVMYDPAYLRAQRTIESLVAITDGGEELTMTVELPEGEFEANSDVYITFRSPTRLTKRGTPRHFGRMMVGDEYLGPAPDGVIGYSRR